MNRRVTVWNPWRMLPRDFFEWDDSSFDFEDIKVDVFEKGDDIVIVAKTPGFSKDDIRIQIESNMVTLSGNVKEETEEEKKDRKYYRKEISTMSFTRSVELPSSVNADQAKAVFKNGMLTITLPKSEEAKPKTIAVEAEE